MASTFRFAFGVFLVFALLFQTAHCLVDTGVRFTETAETGPLSAYRRGEDHELGEIRLNFINYTQHHPILFPHGMGEYPQQTNGAPGVIAFDYDNSGRTSFFVTNTAPKPHSLFRNKGLDVVGNVIWEDVAAAAGVDAPSQTGGGACFSDIDNDGDLDFLVLSQRTQHHLLFRNRGDGTFAQEDFDMLIPDARFGSAVACSWGDVNGDGYPDVAIANAYDMRHLHNCMGFNQAGTEFNPAIGGTFNNLVISYDQGTRFVDESIERGIYNYEAGITWSVELVDYDEDGDLDLFFGSDQCLLYVGAYKRGRTAVYINDGTGHFADRSKYLNGTIQPNNLIPGDYNSPWMSCNFATLGNLDGSDDELMDYFSTDMGSYGPQLVPFPEFYFAPTGWFFQEANGSLSFPGLKVPFNDFDEGVMQNPFGWGSVLIDVDNDGAVDMVYDGLLDGGAFVLTDNPFCMIINDGYGRFARQAVTGLDSIRRQNLEIHGLAYGDFNNDGFEDIVSVAGIDVSGDPFRAPYPFVPTTPPYLSPFDFDPVPTFIPGFIPVNFTPEGQPHFVKLREVHMEEGPISVAINSGTDNNWIKVVAKGSIGRVEGAKNQLDGIGAVIAARRSQCTQNCLVKQPVVGGDSHASQSELPKIFGLGSSTNADVQIFWPNTKATNYANNVQKGATFNMYEIPCDVKDTSISRPEFAACVTDSAYELLVGGYITGNEYGKIISGNMVGYTEYH